MARRRTKSRQRRDRGAGPGGRERLLQAAIRRFAEKGYAATGIADVCAEAGVAKTALYWHYESKEGLLAAVVEAVGNQWIERLQKAVYLEGDPLQRIDRLVGEWRQILLEQPELLRLPLVTQLEQGDSDVARTALRKVWRRAEQALVQGIEDTVGCSLPDVDLLAHTVFVLLQGAMLRQMADPDPDGLERVLDDLRRTIVLLVYDRLPEDARYRLREAVSGSEAPGGPRD
ncbi:MAG: TetR/AcrR family transcriptional regulator [Proteobacteria bacterium]|nr:TetR/AcrR family transcriptional regulator [Pseudomonadota bacterium]